MHIYQQYDDVMPDVILNADKVIRFIFTAAYACAMFLFTTAVAV